MIRNFEDRDKEQLRQLVIASNLYQKGELETESLTDAAEETTSNLFESILSHNKQQYIVAEIDKNIVGFVLVEVSPIYLGRGSIDDLFILEEYRGKKLSNELLQAGLNWLKENKVKRVGLGVHKSNKVAIHLYKKFGFREQPETYFSLERDL